MEIDFKEFQKIELLVGKIVSAEKLIGKDKLIKIRADIGEKEIQLVAGIAQYYKLDELAGKEIVVVKNLKPVFIGGLKSEGMLLAAYSEKENVCALISPGKKVKPGIKVE